MSPDSLMNTLAAVNLWLDRSQTLLNDLCFAECLTGRPLSKRIRALNCGPCISKPVRARSWTIGWKLSNAPKISWKYCCHAWRKGISATISQRGCCRPEESRGRTSWAGMAIPIQKRFAQLPLKARFAIVLSALAILGYLSPARKCAQTAKGHKLQNISDSAKLMFLR